jgi:hypothetical protein
MRWRVTLVAEVEPGRMTEHEIPSCDGEDDCGDDTFPQPILFQEHEERRPRPVIRSTGRRTSSKPPRCLGRLARGGRFVTCPRVAGLEVSTEVGW